MQNPHTPLSGVFDSIGGVELALLNLRLSSSFAKAVCKLPQTSAS